MANMKRDGHDQESAERICGKLKAEHEKSVEAPEELMGLRETAASLESFWLDQPRTGPVLAVLRSLSALEQAIATSPSVAVPTQRPADQTYREVSFTLATTERLVDGLAPILRDLQASLSAAMGSVGLEPSSIVARTLSEKDLYALRRIRIKDRIDVVSQPAVPHHLVAPEDLSASEIALLNGSEAAGELSEALGDLEEAIAEEAKDGDEGLASVLTERLEDIKESIATYTTAPEGPAKPKEEAEDDKPEDDKPEKALERSVSALQVELEKRDPFGKRQNLARTITKLKAALDVMMKAVGPLMGRVADLESEKRSRLRRKRRTAKSKLRKEELPIVETELVEDSEGMDPKIREANITIGRDWPKILEEIHQDIGARAGRAGLMAGLRAVSNALPPAYGSALNDGVIEKLLRMASVSEETGHKGVIIVEGAIREASANLKELAGQIGGRPDANDQEKALAAALGKAVTVLEDDLRLVRPVLDAAKTIEAATPKGPAKPIQTEDWKAAAQGVYEAAFAIITDKLRTQYEAWKNVVGAEFSNLANELKAATSKNDLLNTIERIMVYAKVAEKAWVDNFKDAPQQQQRGLLAFNRKTGGDPKTGAWRASQLTGPLTQLKEAVQTGEVANRLGRERLRDRVLRWFGRGTKLPGKSAPILKADVTQLLKILPMFRQEAKQKGGKRAVRLIDAYMDLLKSIDVGIRMRGDLTPAQSSALYGHASGVEEALDELGMEDAVETLVDLRDDVTKSQKAMRELRKSERLQKLYRDGKKWLSRVDACSRCLALAKGPAIKKDVDFPGGVPGPPLHPHCVTPDTPVIPGGDILATTERPYRGVMVTIKTVGGHELSCTPNHPVLTVDGWVPAGQLRVDSEVIAMVRGDWTGVLAGDRGVSAARADEVVRRYSPDTRIIKVRPSDFHGDGYGSDLAILRADPMFVISGQDAAKPAVDNSAKALMAAAQSAVEIPELDGRLGLDPVVSITRATYEGDVFNLETVGGYYVADGIVVHNCRCKLKEGFFPMR